MIDRPLTVAVSGAGGRMGRIYVPELLRQGHIVRVYDPQKDVLYQYERQGATIYKNNRALVQGADVVLLLVPVRKTEDVLKDMSPQRPQDGHILRYLKPDVILGSAASSKEWVAEQEIRYLPPTARIVEFHPMHGENIQPKGQNLLTVPVRDDGSGEALMQELFSPTGVKIRHVDSVSEHDQIMGEVQGGNHSVAFSRDTAWYLGGTDPDDNTVYADPFGDAKSLHSRRPLDLNLQVYVVTMMLNRFVPPYVQQYEDVLAEIYRKVIEGRREELYRMFEEDREHLGKDAIKDARERFAAVYGLALDDTGNSHISDLIWAELDKRRNTRPTDFVEFESPHYSLGRMIKYAILGGDIRRFVDNAIDNPQTQWQDFNYARAVAVINQIIQSGDDVALLRHFERMKRFFNQKQMKRNLGTVGQHSTVLSRSLRQGTDEYARAYAEWRAESAASQEGN
ncbi:MAG: prephenate dehydrogenase [Candidatus Aenigmarchaeota archaeon]|nr:prephenate dehydrogenase [Candidatus Aenigmarchaeota archaeon]